MTTKRAFASAAINMELPTGYETRGHSRRDRKVAQLCREIEQLLSMVFAGHEDELLNDLMVDSVIPAPDASHLLVTVYYAGTDEVADAKAIISRLNEERTALRTEVAQAVNRRKAPDISFRLI